MKNSHAEAGRWLEQARYDLRTANWNVQLHAPACFWAQQAAEKSAKAYLYFRGERFVLGHSVAELLEKCKTHDADFESLTLPGMLLDRFYIPTRITKKILFDQK